MPSLPLALSESLRQEGRDLGILVLRLGAMGDILRTLPAVRLLRRSLPAARIVWVVEDRWRVVLEGHPDLDGLQLAPRREWDRLVRAPSGWARLLRSVRAFAADLRRSHPDLVMDFHGNLRSGLVGWFSGAPVRLGYGGHQQKEGNRLFTTHRVGSGDRRTPRMDRNLDLVRALGLPVDPLPDGGLPLVAEGAPEAVRILGDLGLREGALAVCSPGASASQAYKKPPAELLASAASHLAGRGLPTLVVWGPGELEDAEPMVRLAEGRAIAAPPTDLPTLAALLRRARLFYGGDSGPLHLACAVGCPVAGLYGPTDPRVNRPWGVPNRAIAPPGREYTGIKRIDRSSGGFRGVTSAEVASELDSLLREIGFNGALPGDAERR